ncbi:hypothetical protein [Anatilimnocola floriformis]|uniref:hypothetical protein n=1 Tax=Anatilimnocola floriformis TaxID=2948575 RepID=UPI0020C502A2|nr:hypothetical protein [Anatilimnocola floriformis]
MSEKKPKDPLKPIRVRERDRLIYNAVKIQRRNQVAVGQEYGLTQQRVSAIVKRVEVWLSLPVPEGFQELNRVERLRQAGRAHRMLLEHLLNEAVAAWQGSQQPKIVRKNRTIKGEVVAETHAVTQSGDSRLFKNVLLAAERLIEFEGFDRHGNVDVSVTGRVPEALPITPVEAYREVKRRVFIGLFDTPGDEGIPGAWAEELKQRGVVIRPLEEASDLPGVALSEYPPQGRTNGSAYEGDASYGGDSGETVVNSEKVLCEKEFDSAQGEKQQEVSANRTREKVLLKDSSASRPAQPFKDYPHYDKYAVQGVYFDEKGNPRSETFEELTTRRRNNQLRGRSEWDFDPPPERPGGGQYSWGPIHPPKKQ